ncbi:MAG TPA: pilus assembly protein PilM [Candidatus Omnitrophota bacterium]|nr:pilus assembly protein PilM [Candidatus Omnitrophota bacterium]HRZ15393.1 pilus assembly protein PilM [Candidatus Omnitrophota bacterium]
MKVLGIYLGPTQVTLVECDAKKIVNSFAIPLPKPDAVDIELKAPDLNALQALIKDGMKRHLIEAKSAFLVVPGKDLIIRSFHMNPLPAKELNNAVKYEVKKYIPFKLEELVADYRAIFDRSNKKNLILFVGIKKDVLEKYNGLLTQLGLKAESVEYSGFSMLRMLQLAMVKEKETVAVVNADPLEEDEVNFIVMEDGFPLFNRDIILTGTMPEQGMIKAEKLEMGERQEKLKIELRLSMDFYLRKFPTKNLKKFIFICPPEIKADLEIFSKERGLASRYIDSKTFMDKPGSFSLSLAKAYSGALNKIVPVKTKVDLLSIPSKVAGPSMAPSFVYPAEIKFDPRFLIFGILSCLVAFGLGTFQKNPVKQQLDDEIANRPRVGSFNPNVEITLEAATAKRQQFSTLVKEVDAVIKKRLLITGQLDGIPRLIPEGVWLKDLRYKQEKDNITLVLQGLAFLDDSNKEIETINKFVQNLRDSDQFKKDFKEFVMENVNKEKVEDKSVTGFSILCKTLKR